MFQTTNQWLIPPKKMINKWDAGSLCSTHTSWISAWWYRIWNDFHCYWKSPTTEIQRDKPPFSQVIFFSAKRFNRSSKLPMMPRHFLWFWLWSLRLRAWSNSEASSLIMLAIQEPEKIMGGCGTTKHGKPKKQHLWCIDHQKQWYALAFFVLTLWVKIGGNWHPPTHKM